MDVLGALSIMVTGLWLFLPAMLPNSAAVVFGGGTKMDFGKSWRGKRIFGDGKSWRGFFGGAFSGILLGLILIGISHIFDPANHWGYGETKQAFAIVCTLAFGAVLGDLCGAFIKRRLGLERGQKAPILDQYDFVAGALLFTALFNGRWVYGTYVEGWNILALIFLLLIMFGIHRGINIIGYRAGLKKEPW
ncbi:MAG: CDP-2,3-bis-(O-geranylgeranyl)-sn-glycerol synthase [Candidatus Methanomethylophilaceae archaeon]|jgi:CDP-2,3-bis-(O-geranylgeranyl)-sn-glycerol synthase